MWPRLVSRENESRQPLRFATSRRAPSRREGRKGKASEADPVGDLRGAQSVSTQSLTKNYPLSAAAVNHRWCVPPLPYLREASRLHPMVE